MTATATWSVRPSQDVSRGTLPVNSASGGSQGCCLRGGAGFGAGRSLKNPIAAASTGRPPCCRKRINRAWAARRRKRGGSGTCSLTRAPGRSSGPAPAAPATESPGQNDEASALIPRSRLITYRERTLRRARAERRLGAGGPRFSTTSHNRSDRPILLALSDPAAVNGRLRHFRGPLRADRMTVTRRSASGGASLSGRAPVR